MWIPQGHLKTPRELSPSYFLSRTCTFRNAPKLSHTEACRRNTRHSSCCSLLQCCCCSSGIASKGKPFWPCICKSSRGKVAAVSVPDRQADDCKDVLVLQNMCTATKTFGGPPSPQNTTNPGSTASMALKAQSKPATQYHLQQSTTKPHS